MLRFILILAASLVAPFAGASETSPHVSLKDPSSAQPWHSVGRLDLGNGFCTGAMISPKLVLTAAHCIYDGAAATLRQPGDIVFKAGYRHGRAIAKRRAKRFLAYSDYDHSAENTIATIANDVAVIELENPIRNATVIPFERIRRPAPNARLMVVSYAAGREEVPALEDGCRILRQSGDVLQYNCDIDSGSSGAPVFVMTDAGPKIASVMSSVGTRDGEDVSFGVALGPRLDRLVRALQTTQVDPRFVKARAGSIASQLGFKRASGSKLPQIKRQSR